MIPAVMLVMFCCNHLKYGFFRDFLLKVWEIEIFIQHMTSAAAYLDISFLYYYGDVHHKLYNTQHRAI